MKLRCPKIISENSNTEKRGAINSTSRQQDMLTGEKQVYLSKIRIERFLLLRRYMSCDKLNQQSYFESCGFIINLLLAMFADYVLDKHKQNNSEQNSIDTS